MMTTLVTPVLLLVFDRTKYGKLIVLLIGLLAITTTVSNFQPEDFLGRTDEYYLKKFIPVPLTHPEYHHIQEEYLRLPIATKNRPDKVYPLVEVKNGSIEVSYSDGLNSEIKVWGGDKLEYYRYNFPGWAVTVNGNPVQLNSGDPYGQISVDLPDEQSDVSIKFTETSNKLALDLVSLAALILALLLAVKGGRLYGITR